MKFSTVFAGLAVLLPLASAVDLRQLVTFDSDEYPSGADFCSTWVDACHGYVPSDDSLIYASSTCTPGDYQGKNTNTEALVTCVFQKPFTNTIASELGASST